MNEHNSVPDRLLVDLGFIFVAKRRPRRGGENDVSCSDEVKGRRAAKATGRFFDKKKNLKGADASFSATGFLH